MVSDILLLLRRKKIYNTRSFPDSTLTHSLAPKPLILLASRAPAPSDTLTNAHPRARCLRFVKHLARPKKNRTPFRKPGLVY